MRTEAWEAERTEGEEETDSDGNGDRKIIRRDYTVENVILGTGPNTTY